MDNIHIPSTPQQFAAARAALLSATVLGFDTESKPVFNKGQKDRGPHLVQLSTTTDAWLLQIHLYPAAVALAREIMANEHIIKVGFGLANDLKTLPVRLGVPLKNVVDLDHRFFELGYGKELGVRAAIGAVFGLEFVKRKKISMANWALPVYKPAMITYAANDAYTAVLLWTALPGWAAQGGKEDDLPPVALPVVVRSAPAQVTTAPAIPAQANPTVFSNQARTTRPSAANVHPMATRLRSLQV